MWVRASSACYRTFTLGMARSPGFGSTACDYSPCSDSVSLRLPYTVKLATDLFVVVFFFFWFVVFFVGFFCLFVFGFWFFFSLFFVVLFAFPSRYWFTIGRSGVFSLGGWSPHVQTGFHVPRLTHFSLCMPFRLPGYHRLGPAFPGPFD